MLLLDEPMAALDVTAAPALRRLLREILRDNSRTAIIVTHDLLDALAIADKVVVFERGRIVESGPVRTVLTVPAQRLRRPHRGCQPDPGSRSPNPGSSEPLGAQSIPGSGTLDPGDAAVALFRPAAVAVHLDAATRQPPQRHCR